MKTKIIALSGKARSGKNSVYFLSKILLDEDDNGQVQKAAFADALKAEAFDKGWSGKKDDVGRKLLQDLGTDRRKEDPLYWVKQVRNKIAARTIFKNPQPKVWFITDCRYLNEADYVKEQGWELWRIRRPAIEHTQTDQHPSEVDLDDYPSFDAVLVANDMTELFEAVKKNLNRLGLV